MKRVWMVLCVVACGPKSNVSNPNLDKPVSPPPNGPPVGTSTGSVAHLQCRGNNRARCQAPDYVFDANYDTPSQCRWNASSNELDFVMNAPASGQDARVLVHITNYHGPDTYSVGPAPNLVSLSTRISRPDGECGPASSAGAEVAAPKYACQACRVVIQDPNPAAPYPKQLSANISCTNLCQEDGWTCDGVNLTLAQQCEHR